MIVSSFAVRVQCGAVQTLLLDVSLVVSLNHELLTSPHPGMSGIGTCNVVLHDMKLNKLKLLSTVLNIYVKT